MSRYLTNSLGTNILASTGRGVQLSSSQSVDLSFPSSSNLVYMKDGTQTVETSVVTVKTLTNGTFKDFYAFASQLSANDLVYIRDNAEKMYREVNNLYGKAPFTVPLDHIGNVKDYGAKGDGVTDDRAAVQACFDDDNVTNVWFPAGTYLIGPMYDGSNSGAIFDSHIKVIFSDANAKITGVTGDVDVIYPMRAGSNIDGFLINGLSFENVAFVFADSRYTFKNITVQNCYFEVVPVNGVWDENAQGGTGAGGYTTDGVVNLKVLNNKFVNIVGGAIGIINRADYVNGKRPTNAIYNNTVANNEIYFDSSVAPIKDGYNIGISFGEGIEASTIEHNFVKGYQIGIENFASTNSIIKYNYCSSNITGGNGIWDTGSSLNTYIGYNYIDNPDTSIGTRDLNNATIEHNVGTGQIMLTTSGDNTDPVSAIVKYNHVVSDNKDAIVILHFPNATINNNYVESSAHRGIVIIGDDSINERIDNNRYFIPNADDFANYSSTAPISYTNNVDVAQEIVPTYFGLPLYANLTSSIPMNDSGSSVYDHKQDTSFSISSYDSSVNKTDLTYGTQSIMFDVNGDINGMMNFQDGDASMYVKDIATYPIKIEETTENDDIYTYEDNGTSATLDTNGNTVSTAQLTNIKLGEISRLGGATSTVVKLFKVFE